jgi:hypothetical protein
MASSFHEPFESAFQSLVIGKFGSAQLATE